MNPSENNGINKDGSFRAKRIGINYYTLSEIYSSLVTMSWAKFFLIISVGYVVLSLLFTLAYVVTGFENLNGLHNSNPFWEVFLYSAQTMSTVGGVGITPVGIASNLVLTVESMMALLCMAIITGLLFVRFSRPAAKIIFSENALIAPHKDGKALMVRVVNAKRIEVVELSAHFFFLLFDPATNKRSFRPLTLEQSHIPWTSTTWTLVHPITEGSPFFNMDQDKMNALRFDLSIYIGAIDSVTGQNVFSRYAYHKKDIIWNAKFLSCGDMNDQGETLIYLERLGDYEELK